VLIQRNLLFKMHLKKKKKKKQNRKPDLSPIDDPIRY
jgi:hypothetical protein